MLGDVVPEDSVKRRKVRKGTQSCWECKRRKVRCIMGDQACLNCRRRGTNCITQDLPEVQDANDGTLTPAASETSLAPPCTLSTQLTHDTSGKYHNGCKNLDDALRSAWPGREDIRLITNLPVGLSVHFHKEACRFYSRLDEAEASTGDNLQLPPPGSHPILVARALLLLGNHLQGIVASEDHGPPKPGSKYFDIMSHAVNTAIKLVTKNEDLISSVEGIECVMLEAAYQNYAGNLHQAWMAVRRATTIAQVLGLGYGTSARAAKFLEPQSRRTFSVEMLRLRLVQMEYYLCLMLGLPRSALQSPSSQSLEAHRPEDHLQQTHLIVADRVLQEGLPDVREMDWLLEHAAAGMPPQWWLVPELTVKDGTRLDLVREMDRLNTQFAHYHLLIRVHLPYLMRSSCEHNYSKMTAVNASRETLTRYLAFRIRNRAHFYCRGADYLCFVSATVLCVAHIERWRQTQVSPSQSSNAFGFLRHSRASDVGMLERILETVRTVSQGEFDTITPQILQVLEQLLRIESSAAQGTRYNVEGVKGNNSESCAYRGEVTDRGDGLRLHIPYYGTINLLRQEIQISPNRALSNGDSVGAGDNTDLLETADLGVAQDWDMQGIDQALFDELFGSFGVLDASHASKSS